MNFVLSGGGTAGHINPALALAEELSGRGHTIHFAGTPQGVEARLVPEAGINFTAFEASGFNRRHPLSLVRALSLMNSSTKAAKRWFGEVQPAAAVCFGGYVCIPVGRAAQQVGIPVVVHEQNSVMGMANKYLSKKAARVALTYQDAATSVSDASKTVLTGNPVRAGVLSKSREEARAYLDVPSDATLLLVFGGSLGARHINEAICSLKDDLLSFDKLYVHHITGPKEYEAVCTSLALAPQEERRWRVVSYEDHMAEALAASDAVVSRAGASSLAEISARHLPALLVPFPFATADHQSANAKSLVECGAAFMVADAELEGAKFKEHLQALISDAGLRKDMSTAAAKLGTQNAATALADLVCEVATRPIG